MKHIPRFFISPREIGDGLATLQGEDLKHLVSVLRVRPGDRVILLDGQDNSFSAELLHADKEKALLRIRSQEKILSEPLVQITLAAALLKGEKFDLVIQKATELGVSRVIPFLSSHTIAKIPSGKQVERIDRLQKIAKEAAEQSERGKIPLIAGPLSFEELCSLNDFDLKLICAERGGFPGLKTVLRKGEKPAKILALVGPEGGFTEEEIQLARSKNFTAVSLGKRILRSETASFLLLSNLFYELEDQS